jgi:hypothetical protein
VANVLGIAPDKLLLFWIPNDMAVPTTSVEQEPAEHDPDEGDVCVKEEAKETNIKMEFSEEEGDWF